MELTKINKVSNAELEKLVTDIILKSGFWVQNNAKPKERNKPYEEYFAEQLLKSSDYTLIKKGNAIELSANILKLGKLESRGRYDKKGELIIESMRFQEANGTLYVATI